MKESLNYLKQLNISKKEFLVVATSGGPDSMALLYMLKTHNYNVICAHVNHNLRKVSDEEYIFVENYCKQNNIPFEGMKIYGYKNNKFTENEAREKRYNFFKNILKKYNSKYLFTAHHGDDLIETILMRLNRGSNINGYKGFSSISTYNDFYIVRPLIFYTKKEIENYCTDNNIKYVIDETNKSKKYTRNRLRLDVLPILKEENKNVHKKYIEFSKEIEENSNFINEYVEECINNNYKNNELDLIKFKELNKYIKKKEIEKILFTIYKNNIILINKKHIENIINLINNNKMGEIYLPKNLKIIKSYNKLIFNINNNKEEKYKYIFNKTLEIPNIGMFNIINDTKEKSNYVIKLNSKDIKLPLIIRTRIDNDYIEVKNMNGKKKINKIFIDEKIEKSKRDTYPIVTDSNNTILWIPGVKKSKFDCYNKEIYDIIIKYTKKEENVNEKK